MASLFNRQSIGDYYDRLWEELLQELNGIAAEEICRMDAETVGPHLAAKYQVDCPVLVKDEIVQDELTFHAEQAAVTVLIRVPFTGSKELFQCRGRCRPLIFDTIGVQQSELVIPVEVRSDAVGRVREQLEGILRQVEGGLASIRSELEHLQPGLARRATAWIQNRQSELASQAALGSRMETIGFPIRKRQDAKESLIVPVKPKLIEVKPPPTPQMPAPEPELALADYDAVLQVIRDMVMVFERSPSVFRAMEEEHLRTILLVALNGLFQGGATGETFNGSGKTDILIRVGNRNVFIAECLIWGGPDHFRKKLTHQLFDYATWRDSKLAAIIFNRNKNFSNVVQRMRETAGGLPNCQEAMPYPCETACRHRFRREDDPGKQFVLTCLAFEVPS